MSKAITEYHGFTIKIVRYFNFDHCNTVTASIKKNNIELFMPCLTVVYRDDISKRQARLDVIYKFIDNEYQFLMNEYVEYIQAKIFDYQTLLMELNHNVSFSFQE